MTTENQKAVLIVGATSAIAHESAKLLASEGARFFLVGRTKEKLEAIATDLEVRGASGVFTASLDSEGLIANAKLIDEANSKLGGIDVALVAHGILGDHQEAEADPKVADEIFRVNFTSCLYLLTRLANYFTARKAGTIVVISSVAGDRGRSSNYVYGASKAALSTLLQGMRQRLHKSGVNVLTIKPGFVSTPMTAHIEQGPLFASAEVVGHGIHCAIKKGKSVVYLPFFWRLIMTIIKHIPEVVFKRLKL